MKRSLITVIISILFILGAVSCAESSTAPAAAEGCSKIAPPDGAQTVLIPGGTFKMGSPASDDSAAEDEFPEHDVALGCYTIYREEVTNSQYQQCVEAGVCLPVTVFSDDMTRRYGNTYYADYPVVGVDYNMASQYCAWIGGRLPTEAEWEYASTSSEEFLFPWGSDEPDCDRASFAGCLDPADTVEGGSLTSGQSPFGVQDMAGNAWEWVFDWYDPEYYAVSPTSSPTGPLSGETKVVRGGSFNSDLHMLLSTNRHAGNPYRAYSNVGFRCVIAPFSMPEEQVEPIDIQHIISLISVNLEDDPEGSEDEPPSITLAPFPLSCPDGSGEQHFSAALSSTEAITGLTFSLEGAEFSCQPYDSQNGLLFCTGAPPAAQENAFYSGLLCLELEGGISQCLGMALTPPGECASQKAPTEFHAFGGCATDLVAPAALVFDPAVFWYKIESMSGTPIDCTYDTPNRMTCLFKNVTEDRMVKFLMYGIYEGEEVFWNPHVYLESSCEDSSESENQLHDIYYSCKSGLHASILYIPPLTEPPVFNVNGVDYPCEFDSPKESMCYLGPDLEGEIVSYSATFTEDHQAGGMTTLPMCSQIPEHGVLLTYLCSYGIGGVRLEFVPEPPAEIQMISVPGKGELNCTYPTPAQADCYDLPGEPGDTLTIRVDYTDGTFDELSTYMRDCSSSDSGTTAYTYQNGFGCEQDGEYYLNANIEPAIGIQQIVVDGMNATCTFGVGYAYCPNLKLDLEKEKIPVQIYYGNDSDKTFNLRYPDCRQESNTCPCSLVSMECLSESRIAFIIDACTDNPGNIDPNSFIVNYGDEIGYTCSVIPGVLGRMYCVGSRTFVEGYNLNVYFKMDNTSRHSCEGLGGWFAAQPNCQQADQPAQPDQPAPVTCSIYTNKSTCEAAGCTWKYGSTIFVGTCE